MNKLLLRQIEKYLSGKIPSKEFQPFLSAVSEAYDNFDKDRELIEHSLEVSSRELSDLNNSLIKERDFSKTIVNTAPAIILVLDPKGKIVDFNTYMEELTGYKLDEVKGKDWFTTFLPKCDYSKIRKLFQNAIGNVKTKGNINPIVTKNGREIFIEWYDKALKDKDGKVIGLLAIGQDITEQKKADEALKESEGLLKGFINSDNSFVFLKDEDFKYIIINKANADFFGKEIKDIIGKTDFELMPKLTAMKCRQSDKEALLTKKIVISEELMNGVYYETRKFPVFNNNKLIGVGGIIRDVTERQKAEEFLKTSEEKYRSLIESATDQIFMIDKNYKLLSANRVALNQIKKPIKKIAGKQISNFLPKNIIGQFKKYADYVFRTGLGKKNIEEKMLVENQEIFISASINPVKDSKGKVFAVTGIIRDITEQKKAEQSLSESEKRFRTIFDKINDAIVVHDAKTGQILNVNKTMSEMYGFTKEEILKVNVGKISSDVHPYTQKEALRFIKKTAEGNPQRFEWHAKTKSGMLFWVEVNLQKANIDYKDVVLAIVRDITERKQTEDELHRKVEQMEFMGRANIKRHKEMLDMEKEIAEYKKRLNIE